MNESCSDKDCELQHCYGCRCHLKLDKKGFVISWYCPPCKLKVANEVDSKPKTIGEIQARIRKMKETLTATQQSLTETNTQVGEETPKVYPVDYY